MTALIIPNSMETAPRNHTMVRLLVDYSDAEQRSPLDDSNVAWTIGHNGEDDTGENFWQFVGWSWTQDCFVDRTSPLDGVPIGWLPFHTGPAPSVVEAARVIEHNATLQYQSMVDLHGIPAWDSLTEGDRACHIGSFVRALSAEGDAARPRDSREGK